jgi:hypothetical protein
MNERRIRIEKVTGPQSQSPKPESLPSDSDFRKKDAPVNDKVISIFDRKRTAS